MYEDLIKELNPKPSFNLSWYKDEDLYSDGDVEDDIIKIISENQPEKYVDAIANSFNWPIYYHLTHVRRNILNWYPMKEDASVLEIGCGFGAITGMLCQKCNKVTAVELSKRRATGALLRCREYDNLDIIVGNLNDIEFTEKFDYITLIGVLEYQGSYTNTSNPYMDFLVKIKSLLKDDGKLLIAIENQYGLKYWCGAREDHTNIPFDGINQYRLSNRPVRTFSKNGLDELVKMSGFKNTHFYYPMPDYKLPKVIYSEKQLPKHGSMADLPYYYIPNTGTLIAPEQIVYNDLIDNDVFEFFANSFLVECSDDDNIGEVIFATLNSERVEEYRIGTLFTKNGKVSKISIEGDSVKKHLVQIKKNTENLKQHGLDVLENCIVNDELVMDYVDYTLLEDELLRLYDLKDEEKIYEIFDLIYQQILMSSDEQEWSENVMYTLGMNVTEDKDRYGKILKIGYLDMLPKNAFLNDGKLIWFDQEWILENVPASFAMFRVVARFYTSFKSRCQGIISFDDLAQRYNFIAVLQDYIALEKMFLGVVEEPLIMQEQQAFAGDPKNDSINNIAKMLNV